MEIPKNARLIGITKKTERVLSEVMSLQRDHVSSLCSKCKEPCCKRVEYLFDEKDVIFLGAVFGQPAPARVRTGGKGCPYLSSKGCTLEPKKRPFTCHRYLCDDLRREIIRKSVDLLRSLDEKIARLDELRVALWGAYLESQ